MSLYQQLLGLKAQTNSYNLKDTPNQLRDIIGANKAEDKSYANINTLGTFIIAERLSYDLQQSHFTRVGANDQLSLHSVMTFMSNQYQFQSESGIEKQNETPQGLNTNSYTNIGPMKDFATKRKCPIWSDKHMLRTCPKSIKMNVEQRIKETKNHRHCKIAWDCTTEQRQVTIQKHVKLVT
jgi:hypothetical protein